MSGWFFARQPHVDCYCGHAQMDHDSWGWADCLECECMKFLEREVNGVPMAPREEPEGGYYAFIAEKYQGSK